MRQPVAQRRRRLLPMLPFFVWVPVAAALYVGTGQFTKLYFIWSYDWRGDGRSYGDIASRWYVRCTYIGWGFHAYTEYPNNGKCGWVRFVKDGRGRS